MGTPRAHAHVLLVYMIESIDTRTRAMCAGHLYVVQWRVEVNVLRLVFVLPCGGQVIPVVPLGSGEVGADTSGT